MSQLGSLFSLYSRVIFCFFQHLPSFAQYLRGPSKMTYGLLQHFYKQTKRRLLSSLANLAPGPVADFMQAAISSHQASLLGQFGLLYQIIFIHDRIFCVWSGWRSRWQDFDGPIVYLLYRFSCLENKVLCWEIWVPSRFSVISCRGSDYMLGKVKLDPNQIICLER